MRSEKKQNIEIIKRWFYRYLDQRKKIKRIEYQIAEIQSLAAAQSIQYQPAKAGATNKVTDPVVDYVICMEDVLEELLKEVVKAYFIKEQIKTAINLLEDKREKRILEEKFLKNKSLKEISKELKLSIQQIIRIQNSALLKIKITDV